MDICYLTIHLFIICNPCRRRADSSNQIDARCCGNLAGSRSKRVMDEPIILPMQKHESAASNARPRLLGRLAPTPSGRMHLGNVFSSLMAWVSAKSQGGEVLLRIEDLDPATQTGDWDAVIMDDLHWLGLDWDEGPVYQHNRIEAYEEAFVKLCDLGLVYPCFCSRAELHAATAPHASDGTPIYNGRCRGLSRGQVEVKRKQKNPAMRLRVPDRDDPNATIEFCDLVCGAQKQCLAQECGDFLVRRSDGVFAYQLAVALDDAQMGVREVVRGNDLLSSTPRQMYVRKLLGFDDNIRYAHIPMLMSPDGKRLSKRDLDCGMDELRERFKTPENLIGFLAHQCGLTANFDPISPASLAEHFDWAALSSAPREIYLAEELSAFEQ